MDESWLTGPWRVNRPLVLYRSVSIPELANVFATGAIRGGGNRFNVVDRRPYVFFADELDARLIRQGEDAYRQAYRAAEASPEHHRCLQLEVQIAEHMTAVLRQMKAHGLWWDRGLVDLFLQGDCYGQLKRAARRVRGKSYATMFSELRLLKKNQWHAWSKHGELVSHLANSIEAEKERLPYTSAVLVTAPLSGCLLYTAECGCGLGEREYGFEPGSVSAADLSAVILFKRGQEVRRIDLMPPPT